MCQFNEFEGNASLQNSLELACENFKSIPTYGRREVLIVFSSLTNSDPGDIQATIRKLVEMEVQVNIISLSAAIYILQNLCQQTQGQFYLAKNKEHLAEILDRFLVPSETDQFSVRPHESKRDSTEDGDLEIQERCQMIKIGFPTRQINFPQVCTCHGQPKNIFYTCPNC